MKNTKRILLAAVAALLLVAVSVGGTIAYLTATTGSVNNTFTPSNVKITLEETTGEEYKMVPGFTITKDPTVTVVTGSEDCWLFVKVDKLNKDDNITDDYGTDDFISYTIADGWAQVTGTTNVYARKVLATDTTKSFAVLKDNQVTVNDTVTEAMMEKLSKDGAAGITLTFTAYATQLYKTNGTEFGVTEAWGLVNPAP